MKKYEIHSLKENPALKKSFDELPLKLYPKNSLRFQLGFDPISKYLIDCFVLFDNTNSEACIGRFAFYENPQLRYQGEKVACIGSYECIDNPEASHALLEYAKRLAKKGKYAYLIGPMEGSSWNNYRFNVNPELPLFFMEPQHKSYYPNHFEQFGFKSIAKYFSSLAEDISVNQQVLKDLEQRYINKGIHFRSIQLENLAEELQKLGALSLKSFENNFLYTAISELEFIQKYQAVANIIKPELVQLAEDEQGEIQAFIFCLPDYYDPSKETFIIKTLARKPSFRLAGIGTYLSLLVYQKGAELGYTKAIHALMYADNISLKSSYKNGGGPFKEYHLYALEL